MSTPDPAPLEPRLEGRLSALSAPAATVADVPTDRALTEAVHASIRARMEEQGVSMKALAERVGMNRLTLTNRLSAAGNLDLDDYERLAHALGARDLEELLADARRGL